MSSELKRCPKCGTECERDEVDVGVGVVTGPWGCRNCYWSEADGPLAELLATQDDLAATRNRAERAERACGLALPVLADAIMHGMPVTRAVADARNAVCEVLRDTNSPAKKSGLCMYCGGNVPSRYNLCPATNDAVPCEVQPGGDVRQ